MDANTSIVDLLEKVKKEELDFLPPDEGVRDGFMSLMEFLILSI